MTLSPLQVLKVPENVDYDDLESTLGGLKDDTDFMNLVQYFDAQSTRSLLPPHARAHLYTVVRALKPNSVVEIGTFLAGTSEILARALWANGSGHLHTIAPFRGEEVRAIMAEWPDELRSYATFHDKTSAAFFAEMGESAFRTNLTLIDGNHEFEFVLFDLFQTARCSMPNALIFMDNISQPGVYWAEKLFLRYYSAWKEYGISPAGDGPTELFNSARSALAGTDFSVLKAPFAFVVMPGICFATGLRVSSVSHAFAIKLRPLRVIDPIRVHLQIILRAITESTGEELISECWGVVEPGKAQQIFKLDRSIRSAIVHANRRYVEVVLALEGPEPLYLAAEPEVIGDTALSEVDLDSGLGA